MQFGDGGDWETTPRIYILKNPVGHEYFTTGDRSDKLARDHRSHGNDGAHIQPAGIARRGWRGTFDLSAIPAAERTGWGWAIGSVDGNANAAGVVNFIPVTELSATGALVPRPYDLELVVNTTTGQMEISNDTTAPHCRSSSMRSPAPAIL